MKATTIIPALTIADVIADTGRQKAVNNFHVFKFDEFTKEKKRLNPIRLDHFMILLTLDGSSKLRMNLEEHTTQKNSLLVFTPNVIVEFLEHNTLSFIGIGFTPEFLAMSGLHKKYIDAFTFFSSNSEPHFNLNDEEAANLAQLLYLLHKKDHSETEHPFREEVIYHGFNLFLFELAAIAGRQRNNNTLKLTRKEDILLRFMRVLAEHFKEERSVQFYADLLYITPKHLTKNIKELTRKTCSELIDDMVIMEAKVLLHNPALSIANVADHLHFSDQFFFSKFFKKHTGFSPSEYKKNM
jgi:AraC family transcriptional activator of pobA